MTIENTMYQYTIYYAVSYILYINDNREYYILYTINYILYINDENTSMCLLAMPSDDLSRRRCLDGEIDVPWRLDMPQTRRTA